ncbi:DNA-directed RNA polymerase subunit alpha [Candidatus Bipolaricaulota bacterium]|nr:DNA-directed RNA polymerase subunit alpha [Candidatus Bipolaricaulota bacterium]MBS3813832.1 DNA-directed RNA polymerase subunit alpha [Candidatus Bipolaricaulota bacterium]MBS3824951.1 DNA-directed RNA polymerase subunit alpha [Candidatus Bipolaricaulota bacterium]
MLEYIEPEDVHFEELQSKYGRLVVGPLERGMGTTLGNSLRRVLMSMIPGAAVTRVRFDGKYHEYDTIEGVREDIIEIIMNVKELSLRLDRAEKRKIYLEADEPGEVTADDLQVESGIEVTNPDHVLAHLSDGAELNMEMDVEAGKGYRSADENKVEDSPLSVIPIDSDFSSIRNVDFEVSRVRAGGREDCDRLELELETDGGIRPEEAVGRASRILARRYELFSNLPEHPFGELGTLQEVEEEVPEEFEERLEDLGFNQRACNLLQEKGVDTLEDLLEQTSDKLLDIHGFGSKTLQKVEEKLDELGYALVDKEEDDDGS